MYGSRQPPMILSAYLLAPAAAVIPLFFVALDLLSSENV
jgi:hypothetical protein